MTDNKKTITELLLSTKREGIERLVDWLNGTDFFTAPASSSPAKHGCKEGGLAEHSLNVYLLFDEKVRRFGLDMRSDESVIAAISHDFCKIDVYKPHYIKGKKKGEPDKISENKPYEKEDRFPVGHGEKSIILASRHIEMTQNEMLLVRWHMGPYDEEFERNRSYFEPVCPAIYAFHFADHEATLYLDERKKKR